MQENIQQKKILVEQCSELEELREESKNLAKIIETIK